MPALRLAPGENVERRAIVAVESTDADWLIYRRLGDVITEENYPRVLHVTDEDLAQHPAVHAVFDVHARDGDGYRFLLSARYGHDVDTQRGAVLDAWHDLGRSGEPFVDRIVLEPRHSEELLAEAGLRVFGGMRARDLRAVSVHLSIAQDDPQQEPYDPALASNRLLAVHLFSGPERRTVTLEAKRSGEAELLRLVISTIARLDPDVVVADGLRHEVMPFLLGRLAQHGLDPGFGREGGDAWMEGDFLRIWGRQTIDLRDLVHRYAEISPKLSRTPTVADAAQLLLGRGIGAMSPRRLRGRRSLAAWARLTQEGAVRHEGCLFATMIEPFLALAQVTPVTLERLVRHEGSIAARARLREEHALRNLALPVESIADAEQPKPLKESRRIGFFPEVLHIDFRSHYPTLMSESEDLRPAWDELGIVPAVLRELMGRREQVQRQADVAPPDQQRELHAEQLALKLLANKLIGAIRQKPGPHRLFRDRAAAARVVQAGREELEALINVLEEPGAEIVSVNTDGLFVATGDSDLATVRRCTEERFGVRVKIAGPYRMLAVDVDDYALMDELGEVTWRGSKLLGRQQPEFVRDLLHQVVAAYLSGTEQAGELLLLGVRQVLSGEVATAQLAESGRLEDLCERLRSTLPVGAAPRVYHRSQVEVALLDRRRDPRDYDRWFYANRIIHAVSVVMETADPKGGWLTELDAEERAPTATSQKAPSKEGMTKRSFERLVDRFGKRRLRLQVLGQDRGLPPCVATTLAGLLKGDAVGYVPIAKLVAEMRVMGISRQEIADQLSVRAGGQLRYSKWVREDEVGGVDVRDERWPTVPHHLGCDHTELRRICRWEQCYRSGEVAGFDEDSSPSFGKYVSDVREGVASIMAEPPPLGITMVEAPPRSGRSWQTAWQAGMAAAAGERVLLLANDHRGVAELVSHFTVQKKTHDLPLGGLRIVHLFGRRTGDTCAFEDDRPCGGCPMGRSTAEDGPNPMVVALLTRKHKKLLDRAALDEVGRAYGLCTYTVSRVLAERADIVLGVHAHLIAPGFIAHLEGERPFDRIYIDEADLLPDAIREATTYRLPLLGVRHESRAPLESDCGDRCEGCHLAFARMLDKMGAPVASGACEPGHEGPRMIEAQLMRGLDVIRDARNLAPGLDLDAVGHNVGLLVEVLLSERDVLDEPHVSPKDYLTSLARKALDVHQDDPEIGPPVAIVEDDKLVRLSFRPCVDPDVRKTELAKEPIAMLTRAAPRYRELLDEECVDRLPQEDARAVELVVRFADFMDHAARRAATTLLVPLIRPKGRKDVRTHCGLELQFVDQASVMGAARLLSKRKTTLLSGTFLDPDLVRRALLRSEEIVVKTVTSPMHREITVIQHTEQGRNKDPGRPRRLDAEHLAAMLRQVAEEARPEPGHQLEALFFAKTIKARNRLAKQLADILGAEARVRRIEYSGPRSAPTVLADPQMAKLHVDVDYLRSPGSRAVDRTDCDVLIVYGNGTPRFDGFYPMVETINSETDAQLTVGDLADHSAQRAVIQALFRPAADPSRRRVLLLVNQMNAADLPEWLQNRRLSASVFYADIGEVENVAHEQAIILGKEVASRLGRPGLRSQPRQRPLTPDDLLEWNRPHADRARQANQRMVDHLNDQLATDGYVSAGNAVGKTQSWGRFLKWLQEVGFLMPIREGRGTRYVITDEYERLLDAVRNAKISGNANR